VNAAVRLQERKEKPSSEFVDGVRIDVIAMCRHTGVLRRKQTSGTTRTATYYTKTREEERSDNISESVGCGGEKKNKLGLFFHRPV
jgi:hypothetical protein